MDSPCDVLVGNSNTRGLTQTGSGRSPSTFFGNMVLLYAFIQDHLFLNSSNRLTTDDSIRYLDHWQGETSSVLIPVVRIQCFDFTF
jgi:hypothetical protein